MRGTVVYLAGGKLFLARAGAEPEPIESPFAQELIDDAARTREKNEWKMRSQTGRLMSGGGLFGGDTTEDATARRIHFSGVTRGGQPGTLLYSLDTEAVGGLFRYDIGASHEQRLFHRNAFRARHLARHPDLDLVAYSIVSEDGLTNIGVSDPDGKGMQVVTEGDSVDESPSWVPGPGQRLVFQSAGIGRDQQGHLAGLGPYAVQMLDLDRGELETVLEDPKTDYMLPRRSGDGALYFIRRPYQAVRVPGVLPILKDLLLLPVRLVWSIFGFLNFFSMMFSGQPLTTSGGPKRDGPSPRYLMLWGKVIDAEKAERASKRGGPAGLVPKDWELVRRAQDGTEEVLAQSVVSYDLTADGVVYTNGSAVFHRPLDGGRKQLCSGKLIEHILVVDH